MVVSPARLRSRSQQKSKQRLRSGLTPSSDRDAANLREGDRDERVGLRNDDDVRDCDPYASKRDAVIL